MSKKSYAFTLVEVLITIVVIGIVAALVIPQVVTNYRKMILEMQRKKATSILTDGFKFLMVHDKVGQIKNTNLMSCDDDKTCITNQIGKVFRVVQDNNSADSKFERKYQFESGEQHEVWTDLGISYVFIVPDGMIFGISPDSENHTINLIGDINGEKNPNKGGVDLCRFVVSSTGVVTSNCAAMANFTPTPPPCSPDNPDLCTKETCTVAGYYWGGGSCWNSYEEYAIDDTIRQANQCMAEGCQFYSDGPIGGNCDCTDRDYGMAKRAEEERCYNDGGCWDGDSCGPCPGN